MTYLVSKRFYTQTQVAGSRATKHCESIRGKGTHPPGPRERGEQACTLETYTVPPAPAPHTFRIRQSTHVRQRKDCTAEEESITSPTVLTSRETEAQRAQETDPASHSQSEAKLGCYLASRSSQSNRGRYCAYGKWPWIQVGTESGLGAEEGLVECWKRRPRGFEAGAGRGVGFVRHEALPGCSGARASGQERKRGTKGNPAMASSPRRATTWMNLRN